MTAPGDKPNQPKPGSEIAPTRWRKLPVEIEAIRWSGDNLRAVIDFTGRHPSADAWTWEHFEEVVRTKGLKIFTLEGQHMATVGDYIIKGVHGECYPCKPDIFAKTYQRASAATAMENRVHNILTGAVESTPPSVAASGETPPRIEPQYEDKSVSGAWVKQWQDRADQLERELAEVEDANRGFLRLYDHWKERALKAEAQPPSTEAAAEYARKNPLGGPAVVFEAMASRMRAGEDYYAVLRDYDLQHIPKQPPETRLKEVWAVTNKTSSILFDSEAMAQAFVGSQGASIGGGMHITRISVYSAAPGGKP